MSGDPVMSRLSDRTLDRGLNESWPPDAGTAPGRPRIPVVARVMWRNAGEELVEAYATRWSGRRVFVTPEACDARDARSLAGRGGRLRRPQTRGVGDRVTDIQPVTLRLAHHRVRATMTTTC